MRKLIVNAFVREVILYDDEIVITYTFTDNPEHLKRTKDTTLKTENQIEQAEKSASSYIVSSSIFSHFPPKEKARLCRAFSFGGDEITVEPCKLRSEDRKIGEQQK